MPLPAEVSVAAADTDLVVLTLKAKWAGSSRVAPSGRGDLVSRGDLFR